MFFPTETCARILALCPPVKIPQILLEKFSRFPEIGVTVIFSTFRTLKLCVLVFWVCVLSSPINGKTLVAKPGSHSSLHFRPGERLVVLKHLLYLANDDMSNLILCALD